MPTEAAQRRRFTVVLESERDADDFTAFRRWLKRCHRDYQLRALDISTTPALPPIAPTARCTSTNGEPLATAPEPQP